MYIRFCLFILQSLISRLPDKGENLRRKLEDLTNQLENLEHISSMENSKDATSLTNKESTRVEHNNEKPRKDLKLVKQELQALKDLQVAKKETQSNLDASEVASLLAGLNLWFT